MVHGLDGIIANNNAAMERYRQQCAQECVDLGRGCGLCDLQASVAAFKKKAGQLSHVKPAVIDQQSLDLCLRLIVEECDELKEACAGNNAVGVADGIGDLVYTAVGMCCALGIDFAELMRRICKSNASKFLDGYQIREDGKLLKSPHYEPVDLTDLVHESNKVR